jgi:hypothetical protein
VRSEADRITPSVDRLIEAMHESEQLWERRRRTRRAIRWHLAAAIGWTLCVGYSLFRLVVEPVMLERLIALGGLAVSLTALILTLDIIDRLKMSVPARRSR